MVHGQERFIEIDGERLAYEGDCGCASVLFIHGIPTNNYLWRNLAAVLNESGLDCVAFDLLGYRSSSKPADVDLGIVNQARRLGEAVKRLGWKPGIVVGHDIGGGVGVAQLLAAERPEVVRKRAG